MRKSSTNFRLAGPYSYYHIGRDIAPDYLIDDSSRNECNRGGQEAYEYHLKVLDEAVTNYFRRTKQSIQVLPQKLLWEGVINLMEHHTMKDAKKLASYLEKKYGWQEIQIGIHRDEGHIDEVTGEKIYNFHCHILFLMMSKDGIHRFKKKDFGKKKMSLIQSEVASILGMERGMSKLQTKRVRLNPAQYRQVVKEKEDLEFEIKILKAESEAFEDLALRENEEKQKVIEDALRMSGMLKTLGLTLTNLEQKIADLEQFDEVQSDKIKRTIPSIL